MTYYAGMTYYITFDTEKRGRMEFAVSKDVYYSVREGTDGILHYKGAEFISFR